MNNIGYRNLLIQYIDRQESDQPILTAQITQYVARESGLDHAPVDAAKPEELLKGTVKTLKLDTDVLIYMARKFYNPRILIKTIDTILGGLYETAQG